MRGREVFTSQNRSSLLLEQCNCFMVGTIKTFRAHFGARKLEWGGIYLRLSHVEELMIECRTQRLQQASPPAALLKDGAELTSPDVEAASDTAVTHGSVREPLLQPGAVLRRRG
jgi:hypothetical protein